MLMAAWETLLPELENLFPVAYDHFLEKQALPYALYLDVGSNNFMADDQVFYEDTFYDLEIYTENKNPALESQVESIFNALKIVWKRLPTAYIQTEKMYQTVYQLSQEKKMSNKVKFGLSNCVIWPIESIDTNGKPTYAQAIKLPGGVSLTMDPEESSEPFYADNIVYYLTSANSGYSGELELALVPKEFNTEILGQKEDDAGVMVETTDDKPKEFAMAWQFEGDVNATRHLFPRCSAGRTSVAGKTKEDAIKPETEKLKLTAMGRVDNHIAKCSCPEGTKPYAEWLEEPYEPTFTTTGA